MPNLTRKDLSLLSFILKKSKTSRFDSLMDFESDIEKLTESIERLSKMEIIKIKTLKEKDCPKCGKPLVIKETFATCKCTHIISIEPKKTPEFYSYEVQLTPLKEFFKEKIVATNITLKKIEDFSLTELVAVGEIQHPEGNVNMGIITTSLRLDLLYKLMGLAQSTKKPMILFFPEISEEDNTIFAGNLSTSNIVLFKFEDITNIDLEKTVSQLLEFDKFVSKSLAAIEKISGGHIEQTIQKVTDDLRTVADLSKVGRYKFELPALNKLSIFGLTAKYEKNDYHPDGLLLQPTDLWIVDAKSAEDFYHFVVSERDKARRYITKMEENSNAYGEDLSFKGEIIITRELPPDKLAYLKTVDEYFDNHEIKGKIVIIPIENLIELSQKIIANPGFIQKHDLKKHSRRLFGIASKEFFESELSVIDSKKKEKKLNTVRYINKEMIEKYYEMVMAEKKLINGRDCKSIMETTSQIFLDEFGTK